MAEKDSSSSSCSSASGPVLGINLGNSNSCVAVWVDGRLQVIPNQQGSRVTPSFVAFTDEGILVGSDARQQFPINPENTITGMKRLVGRTFNDPLVHKFVDEWSYKVIEGENHLPLIEVKLNNEKKFFPPEQILALLLSELKVAAETYLKVQVKDVVMTVPVHFNTSQRKAIVDATTIAGLEVLVVINEPTAAVYAYSLEEQNLGETKKVMIFNIGGTTLDVSLVEIHHGTMEVKATTTDPDVGGKKFTKRMVDYFVKKFKDDHDQDIIGNPKATWKLRQACRVAKTLLSVEKTDSVAVEVEGLYKGIDLLEKITRQKFEELNYDLFQKCLEPVERCLKDADVKRYEVDEIVLVGGSSRIPKIRELLQDFFPNKKLNDSLHPDEAVACGAAIQGAKLRGQGNEFIKEMNPIKDVTPFSLGLEGKDGGMDVVIPKNTTLPVKRDIKWQTLYDNQTVVDFKVYEGEKTFVKDNHFLGRLHLSNIAPAPKGAGVVVTFSIDEKGMLEVSATDEKSGKTQIRPISKDAGRLSKEQISQIISKTNRIKSEDENMKIILSAKNELEEFANQVIDQLEEQSVVSKLGDNKLQDKIRVAAKDALEWSHRQDLETDKKEFETRMDNLKEICKPFVTKI